jgi:hypothetical protein
LEDYTFETVWPSGIGDLTQEQIKSLSNRDFARLSKAHRERLIASGYTRRAAIAAVRKLKKVRSKQHRDHLLLQEQEMLHAEYQESPLLNSFLPKRARRWILPSNRRLTTSISAKNFSLLDEPKSTLKTLADIVRFEGIAKSARLNFDDERVLDISPYLLLGLLSGRMAPFITGGKISRGTQRVLEAVELRDFLGIEPFGNGRDRLDVWPFSLQRRHPQSNTSAVAGESISFQKLSDRLVDTVNDWLAALPEPRTLSGEAMGQISNIATETLNNAERHSQDGGNGDWVVAGFMARRRVDDGQVHSGYSLDHWYDCHLAFVNRGRPICDAVMTTPSSEVKNQILGYQKRHKTKAGCSRETLATAFAMQDNISSKPDNAGGKGMMTIVEVTNALSLRDVEAKKPKITILSGKSCVMFRGDYCGFHRLDGQGTGRTQYFNPTQNIERPPSNEHVFDLDVQFPGTVIAVRFTLDPEAMEALNDDS